MLAPVRVTPSVTDRSQSASLLPLGGLAGLLGAVLITPGWIGSVFKETEASSWAIICGHIALLLALVAVYAVQASRLGRTGQIGFVLAFVGNVFAISSMMASLVVQAKLGQRGLEHFIQSGSVVPQMAALSVLSVLFFLGVVLFGIATARAGVFPTYAGRLVAAGAVLAVAGALPDLTAVEAAGTIMLAAGFGWMGWLVRREG